MRTFQVLGITLTDYSVREAMRKVEEYLNDGKVSTVCYITTDGILEAENHPETKTFLENMNLTVAADAEVLKAADILTRGRQSEIENSDFMRVFLHRVAKEKLDVCLISDSEEEAAKLEEGLKSYQASLHVTGRFAATAADTEDAETLINDINVLAPKVIISNLSYPLREALFAEHHMKLHAEVWLILKNNMVNEPRSLSLTERLKKRLSRKALARSVDQYRKVQLKSDTKEIDTEAINHAMESKNPQK